MSLASRTLRAIGWNAAGTGVRFLAQFGTTIVLARLLGPEAFGVIAAAMTVVALGALVSDGGFGAASIVREQPDMEDLSSAQTMQMALACVLLVILTLSRERIARFYGTPRLAEVLPFLALQFPLQALGTAANVTLKRALNFRAIQAAQTGGYVLGYAIVGTSVAAAGGGVWSLVAAQLVFVAGTAAALIATTREYPRFRAVLPSRETLRRGFAVTLSNMGSWLNASIDLVSVGRLFGAVPLGYYSRASTLVSNPTTLIVSLVQSALLPAFVQSRTREGTTTTPFIAAWSIVWLLGLPAAAFVSVTAADIIALLFGPRWSPAAPILAILAALIVLQALVAITSALLWGFGRVGLELGGQILFLAIYAIALAAGAGRMDLRWIAGATIASALARAIVSTWAAARVLQISGARFGRAGLHAVPIALSVALAGSLTHLAGATLLPVAVRLVVAGVVAVGAAAILLLVAPALCLAPETRAVFTRLSQGRQQGMAGRLLRRFAT